MRISISLILFLVVVKILNSQTSTYQLEAIKHPSANLSWYPLEPQKNIRTNGFLNTLREHFYEPELNSFNSVSSLLGKDDIVHQKYQQFYKDIEVLGAEIILHHRKGILLSANGYTVAELQLDIIPNINIGAATEIAKNAMSSIKYMQDSEGKENIHSKLIILDKSYPEYSGEYLLAYQVDLYSQLPLQKKRIYIDAKSGDIILNFDMLMTCFSGPGVAHTLYHGSRQIETTPVENHFELLDGTHGGGIETISATGLKYKDDDNNWESGSFTQRKGGLDVHFGAISTWDYYKKYYNRDGIDGKNGKLLNRVIDTTFYVNAFWDGSASNFGIGDSVVTNPLTSLDVVGHELTHGITQFTCGLEYLYESGALNEGFSDIFGKAIEFEYDSINFNWLLGSRFFNKPDTAFRSMENPIRFGNPKNYKGSKWVSNASDNGGVHSNSGVINYWFYLLCEGGQGQTEKNINFDVKKIGIREATSIIYEAMTKYLTKTSKYYDVRQATLEIVANRFGKCSDEYRNMIEAWVAVGIGARNSDQDIMVVSEKIPQIACKEGLFPAQVRIVNLSCDRPIAKGTEVNMTLKVPQKNTIAEKFELAEDLNPGASIIYKFNTLARIDKTNTLIQIEAQINGDPDTTNNRVPLLISKNSNPEYDFRVNSVNVTGSSCNGNILQAQLVTNYAGCDPIPPDTKFKVILKYDQITKEVIVTNPTTIYSGANFRTSRFNIDRDFLGPKTILAQLDFSNDTLTSNNIKSFNAVYIDNVEIGYLEPFTNNSYDSTRLAVRNDSFQFAKIQSNLSGSEALVITGGKIYDSQNRFIPVNNGAINNFFSSNPKFTSTSYTCLETDQLSKAFLSFDYIQKFGNPVYDTFLINPTFAASTRITFKNATGLALGNPVYITNGARTAELKSFEQEIPLALGPVTIEISHLVLEGAMDSLTQEIDTSKDYVLIDNLKIFGELVSGTKDPGRITYFNVQPNPFRESVSVQINSDFSSENFSYELFNSLGARILQGITNLNPVTVQTADLPSDSYILKLTNSKGRVERFKLIKI